MLVELRRGPSLPRFDAVAPSGRPRRSPLRVGLPARERGDASIRRPRCDASCGTGAAARTRGGTAAACGIRPGWSSDRICAGPRCTSLPRSPSPRPSVACPRRASSPGPPFRGGAPSLSPAAGGAASTARLRRQRRQSTSATRCSAAGHERRNRGGRCERDGGEQNEGMASLSASHPALAGYARFGHFQQYSLGEYFCTSEARLKGLCRDPIIRGLHCASLTRA